jgi:hypothetical protein
MRQYTNESQTTKLIELGFEKPSPKWVKDENGNYRVKANDADYSIGELLSILPLTVGKNYDLHIEFSVIKWYVAYYWIGNGGEYYIKYEFSACELIDTLYMMILKLKEEGMI